MGLPEQSWPASMGGRTRGLSWSDIERSSTMPVILWLLGVPLGLILLFMLVF